ncbi:hypothetical protein J2W23_001329 [Variovorax boronicumulans]|uniref:hypothetical protein n=1 Tax=Variovorax boronicumulans TaxID=436515 RepID=UPI00277E6E66|nr:hypothetical protein [Variovorax boronicumulans]MDQ0012950.1 hypothetical protein [Variovorax boronicumulans]
MPTPEYCLLAIDWWPLCMTKAEWSGWIQAFGSVLAIAGAYWVGERQSGAALRQQHLLAERTESERRKAIVAIAAAAQSRASEIGAIFDEQKIDLARFFREYDKSIVRSLATALSGIPVHELGSAAGVAALLNLRDQLSFLEGSIERWETHRHDSSVVEPGTRDQYDEVAAENVRKHVLAIQRQFNILKTSLGSSGGV